MSHNNEEIAKEIGPLKYISDLTGKSLDQVVNWYIIVLMLVFDPLAMTQSSVKYLAILCYGLGSSAQPVAARRAGFHSINKSVELPVWRKLLSPCCVTALQAVHEFPGADWHQGGSGAVSSYETLLKSSSSRSRLRSTYITGSPTWGASGWRFGRCGRETPLRLWVIKAKAPPAMAAKQIR